MSIRTSPIAKAFTKSQLFSEMAEAGGFSKKQMTLAWERFEEIMHRHLKKRGCGQFTIPGTIKIYTRKRPARKARKGINPFTGQEIMLKARPATTVAKAKVLKKVKEMVE